jgi:hypothetical protein
MSDKRFDTTPKKKVTVREHDRQTKSGTVRVRKHIRRHTQGFRNSMRTDRDFDMFSKMIHDLRYSKIDDERLKAGEVEWELSREMGNIGSAWNADKNKHLHIEYYLDRLDRMWQDRKATDGEAWGDFYHDASIGSDGSLSAQQRRLVTEKLHWSHLRVAGGHSFAGLYLGEGLGSTTDYGRSNDLSEGQMIKKVKQDMLDSGIGNQFLKYKDKNGNVANEIVIVRRDNGYSVIPRFNPALR